MPGPFRSKMGPHQTGLPRICDASSGSAPAMGPAGKVRVAAGKRYRLGRRLVFALHFRMEPLMYRSWFFAAAAMIALLASKAAAEVPLTGFFIARETCPALQSIRNGTNPGEVETAPGKSYPKIAKNKPNVSHYFIEVEGADPSRRWVAVDCGEHVVSADGSSQPQEPGPGEERDSDTPRAEYVLSVSWQPAFCETKRDKTECATQSPERFDATHFTLHGLWPQPRRNAYCDVPPEISLADKDGDWDRLPEPKLSDATRQRVGP